MAALPADEKVVEPPAAEAEASGARDVEEHKPAKHSSHADKEEPQQRAGKSRSQPASVTVSGVVPWWSLSHFDWMQVGRNGVWMTHRGRAGQRRARGGGTETDHERRGKGREKTGTGIVQGRTETGTAIETSAGSTRSALADRNNQCNAFLTAACCSKATANRLSRRVCTMAVRHSSYAAQSFTL